MKTETAKVVIMGDVTPCPFVKILNDLVSNFYVLYTKVWNFHINYVGPDFETKHSLLGDYKDMLSGNIDMLAEEIRKIGSVSTFNLHAFLESTRISDETSVALLDLSYFNIILRDFETIAAALDKAIVIAGEHGKLDTQQLFLDIKMAHNKVRWFIRSILGSQ